MAYWPDESTAEGNAGSSEASRTEAYQVLARVAIGPRPPEREDKMTEKQGADYVLEGYVITDTEIRPMTDDERRAAVKHRAEMKKVFDDKALPYRKQPDDMQREIRHLKGEIAAARMTIYAAERRIEHLRGLVEECWLSKWND